MHKTVTTADLVDELVEPQRHVETYDVITGGRREQRTWRTTHPSLIDQLANALEPSGAAADGHRPPASSPAARLDAIDTHNAIADGTLGWIDSYGIERRSTLVANLRALGGIPNDRNLQRDLAGWITAARITTGWETPAWSPNVPCPMCDHRGGLRIRLHLQSAMCTNCRTTWDSATIGLLAQGIRYATGVADTPDTPALAHALAAA